MATEAKIKSLSASGQLRDFRTLVISTHAFAAGGPAANSLTEPALVLTPPKEASPADDGLLRASEIEELALAIRRQSLADPYSS